jgi:hypothetical protein
MQMQEDIRRNLKHTVTIRVLIFVPEDGLPNVRTLDDVEPTLLFHLFLLRDGPVSGEPA